MKHKGKAVCGWLALDKPAGMTSTQALGRVRRLFGAAKAGHVGTLDPLATGCLPIAFGEATKTIPYLTAQTKAYVWEMAFGQKTDTGDCEGRIIAENDVRPTAAAIEGQLSQFCGLIEQTPPKYSAIKIEGKPAYKKARAGEDFSMASRLVQIDEVRLLGVEGGRARLSCTCQKGVYIRTLAEDIAESLAALAHITQLRRTQNGCFKKDFIGLAKIEEIAYSADSDSQDTGLEELLLPLESVLAELPTIDLPAPMAQRLRFGQLVELSDQKDFNPEDLNCAKQGGGETNVCQILEKGKLVGLALWERETGTLTPKKMFNL